MYLFFNIMNILIVLAGNVTENIKLIIKQYNIDYIIAVDGGYNYLNKENIIPDLYIGDNDSSISTIKALEIVSLNPIKDNTDYSAALDYIQKEKMNKKNAYVLGFVSLQRLEHFYSNLMLIKPDIYYISQNSIIYMLEVGEHELNLLEFKKEIKYISFFAYDSVHNLTLENFKYEVNNYFLAPHDNLCISNEIKDKTKKMRLSFSKGKLLVFLSIDDK